MTLIRITETLDIELEHERWCCNRCGGDLGSAREPWKLGALIRDRDPREIHFPIGPSKEFNFSFDPKWMRIVEFYCPQCAVMIDNEYLPPGHPLTWDIQLDIDQLQARHGVASVAKRPARSVAAKKEHGPAPGKPVRSPRGAG